MKLTTANLRQIIKEELENVLENQALIDQSKERLKDREKAGEFQGIAGQTDLNKRMKQTSLGRRGPGGGDAEGDLVKSIAAQNAAAAKEAEANKPRKPLELKTKILDGYKKLNSDQREALAKSLRYKGAADLAKEMMKFQANKDMNFADLEKTYDRIMPGIISLLASKEEPQKKKGLFGLGFMGLEQ